MTRPHFPVMWIGATREVAVSHAAMATRGGWGAGGKVLPGCGLAGTSTRDRCVDSTGGSY